MTGWWACTIKALPFAAPVAQATPAAVAHHAIRRGIGHGFRKRLVRRWGVSHGAAVAAWRTGVTCVWISGAGAAGGAAWAASPLWWPGVASGFFNTPPHGDVTGSEAPVIAVPEPQPLALFGLSLAALALVRRRR
jgi:hypothetical protein